MICELCLREVDETTEHHLIPRTRHKNKKNKRDFDREDVKETVSLCQPCHSQIHNLFEEKALEATYNTLEALKSEERMMKFLHWVSHKPADFKTQNKRALDR